MSRRADGVGRHARRRRRARDQQPARRADREPRHAIADASDLAAPSGSRAGDLVEELATRAARPSACARSCATSRCSRAREEERRGAGRRRSSVLDSTLRMAWNEIRHRARSVKDYGEVPRVDANESRLGQVFLNLIVNAAQAIPEGNDERNEIRHRRTHTRRATGRRSRSRDTGAGIPPEIRRAHVRRRSSRPSRSASAPASASRSATASSRARRRDHVDSERGRGHDVPRRAAGRRRPRRPAPRRARRRDGPPAPRRACSSSTTSSRSRSALRRVPGARARGRRRSTQRRATALERDPARRALRRDPVRPDDAADDRHGALHAEVARCRPSRPSAIVFVTGGAFTVRHPRQFSRRRQPAPRQAVPHRSPARAGRRESSTRAVRSKRAWRRRPSSRPGAHRAHDARQYPPRLIEPVAQGKRRDRLLRH